MRLLLNYANIHAIFATLAYAKNQTNPLELLHHTNYPLLIKS